MTFEERIDALTARHEALTERHEAMTMNLEILTRDVEAMRARTDALITITRQDGENIRALARIAEMHERHITDLEGPTA